MPFRSLPTVAAAAALLAGCGGEPSPPPQSVRTGDLATLEVALERAPAERRLDGIVEAVNRTTVAAQTAGRVAELAYDVGDLVPAGTVIARLRSAEQQASLQQTEAAVTEAAARDTEAQAGYRRIADMYERDVVPKARLDEAVAARDSAAARLAAARAALESAREGVSYTEIRAPYAGIVTERHVEIGETVAPGTPIMSGMSLQSLRVAVDVPQSIAEEVRRSGKAAVETPDQRIDALRITVFPEAAPGSNTFRARLDLPESNAGLYPGMVVTAVFYAGETESVLVPRDALVERGEVTAVYVVEPEGRIVLRQIRIGRRNGERVEVLAGLVPGERVALDPDAALARQRAAADRR